MEAVFPRSIKPIYVEKRVICKWPKCKTPLSGYRAAKGNKYCTIHSYDGFARDQEILRKKRCAAAKKASRAKKRAKTREQKHEKVLR